MLQKIRNWIQKIVANFGVVGSAAVVFSTQMFPPVLIPRQLGFLEDLGTIIAVLTLISVWILRANAVRISRWQSFGLIAIMGVCAIVVFLMRINYFECYGHYGGEEHQCHLIGWSYSAIGEEMINRHSEELGGPIHNRNQLLFDLGLARIPEIFGTSYIAAKNLFAWCYLVMFSTLVFWLGISREAH